jgi:hypothetical protein
MVYDSSRLDEYVDVASRIVEFRTKHPDGSLQPVNPAEPFKIVEIRDKVYLFYAAAAYRTPDDTRPGIGVAWEPWPGRTPYTRDSEIQNLESSAWGRAIVAALAADTKRGIASAEEVHGRQAEQAQGDGYELSEAQRQALTPKDIRGAIAHELTTRRQPPWTLQQIADDFKARMDIDIQAAPADTLMSYLERIRGQRGNNSEP